MTGVDIHYIAEKLSDKFKISYVESRTCRVKGIRIWNSRDIKSRKDFLYLTDDIAAVQSQRRAVDPAVLFVCLRGSEVPIHSASWNGRVWYLHTCVPLIEIQDEIQDILEDYDAWYGNCVDLILKGKDIADLLDFAAQKLQNPIALFDVTGILIHQAGTFYKDVEGTLWEEVLNSGFTPVEYVMPDELSRIMKGYNQGMRTITGVFRKDAKHHYISAPILLNGKLVGACGSIDLNRPFTKGQEAVVADICRILEADFQQADHLVLLDSEKHRCPKRLLDGFTVNSASIQSYLRTRKWESGDTWRVYHFQLPSPDCTGVVVSAYINQISYVMPRAVLFPSEDAIIGIGRVKDFNPLNRTSVRQLENVLVRISLRCFVSEVFSHFEQLADYHGQCDLLTRLDSTQKPALMLFADYYMEILENELREKATLKGFCHPVIYGLWTSGKEMDRTLVQNLKCYLLNGRSIAETTRLLRIHRNTLIYRMQKIEALLQVSLHDLDENMLCYLLMTCILCTTGSV